MVNYLVHTHTHTHTRVYRKGHFDGREHHAQYYLMTYMNILKSLSLSLESNHTETETRSHSHSDTVTSAELYLHQYELPVCSVDITHHLQTLVLIGSEQEVLELGDLGAAGRTIHPPV